MHKKPRVYVVDDDPAILRAMKVLLEAMDLVADDFQSAEEFLAAYHPDKPELLILDMNLPGMNGLQLQSELKKRSLLLPMERTSTKQASRSFLIHTTSLPLKNVFVLRKKTAAKLSPSHLAAMHTRKHCEKRWQWESIKLYY